MGLTEWEAGWECDFLATSGLGMGSIHVVGSPSAHPSPGTLQFQLFSTSTGHNTTCGDAGVRNDGSAWAAQNI